MTIVPSIGHGVHLLAHRLDGDLIRLVPVALAHRVGAGDRRLLDDAQEVEREIGIELRSRIDGDGFESSRGHVSSPRRQLAARRPVRPVAEQVVGLHQLVNLARAFVDHRALAIAIEPPDRIFVRIAVGAVNLHRVAGRALRRDGREPLRQPGLAACCAGRRSSATRRAATAAATPDSPTPSARSFP